MIVSGTFAARLMCPTSQSAALFARGSSPDQTAAQIRHLRHEAQALGLEVAGEYVDLAVAPQNKRPELDRMLADIRQGRVGVLMTTGIDRLGLTMRQIVFVISELVSRGVHLISINDELDTSTAEGRAALVAITALAAADRALAIERGRWSVRAARRRGSRIGRPRAEVDVNRAVELRAQGNSFRKVAQVLGVGVATIHRALASSRQ